MPSDGRIALLASIPIRMGSPTGGGALPGFLAQLPAQVVAPDGRVLGERRLLHPHVQEQPFTRSLGGVEIPAGVEEVTIRARDSVHGWGGATRTLPVPR